LGAACGRHEVEEKYMRVSVRKHEGKSQLKRDRHRWRIILKYILNK
jgi:hypothetical protein